MYNSLDVSWHCSVAMYYRAYSIHTCMAAGCLVGISYKEGVLVLTEFRHVGAVACANVHGVRIVYVFIVYTVHTG